VSKGAGNTGGRVAKKSDSRAQKLVRELGGLRNADYLGAGQVPEDVQFGFRPGSLKYWRGEYAGKTVAQATRIATNLREPVKVG
jgi:hypothetical protein